MASLVDAQAEGAILREKLLRGSAELLGELAASQVHQSPVFFAWEAADNASSISLVPRTSESRDEYHAHELQKIEKLPQPNVWSPNAMSLR